MDAERATLHGRFIHMRCPQEFFQREKKILQGQNLKLKAQGLTKMLITKIEQC